MYLLLLFIIPVVIYFVIQYNNRKKVEAKEDLPNEVKQTPSTFQIIYTASNPIEANLVVSQLRDAGIQSFLSDENIVSAHSFLSNAVGGVKVKVYAEDYENAVQVLGDYIEPQQECIFCKSTNTMKYYKSGDGVNGDFASFVNTTFVPGRHEQNDVAYHCNDCEREFEL